MAKGMKELLIDEAIESYKDIYNCSKLPENPTEYEQDIHNVLHSLSPAAKESFYRLIENVVNDSVTSFCAFLDGSCGYIGQDSNLLLYSENDRDKKINGELMAYLDNARGVE